MDRTADAAATHELRVGGIHDCVDTQYGAVAAEYADSDLLG
jgi:hypothetical protein